MFDAVVTILTSITTEKRRAFMARKRWLYVAGLGLIVSLLLVCSASADPASWSSFDDAFFHGAYIVPSFANNQTNYTLHLDTGATVDILSGVYAGKTYSIDWIQAFYAVGKTQETVLSATPFDPKEQQNGWNWEGKADPGPMYGWHGQGDGTGERLDPGGTPKTFNYKTFTLGQNNTALLGLHIQLNDMQTGEVVGTGFFKGTSTPVVPELPAPALAGLGTALAAGLSMLRRRLHI